MSTSTTKLGLVKPAVGERLSRLTYNQTLDQIDQWSIDRDKLHSFEAIRTGQNDNPAGPLWGPGNIMGLRQATSQNDDFVSNPSAGTDGLRLTKEGIYTVTWGIRNNSAAGIDLWHIICGDGTDATTANNSPFGRSPAFNIPVGDTYYAYGRNFYVGPSGKDIFFKFSTSTASALLDHIIRVAKLQ